MRHIMGMTLETSVWRNFKLETTNAVFVALFLGVVGPFTAPLAVRLGASKLEMGILMAAPFIANLTAGFWASRSQDGNAVKWVAVPHAIWRSLLGLIGFIKLPWLLVSTSLAAHFAVTAAGPAYGRLVQSVYPAQARGRLMGYTRVLMAGGMFATVSFSGRLLDRFGPEIVFAAAGLCGLVGILFFSMMRDPQVAVAPKPRVSMVEQVKLAFADPIFRRFLIAALLFHGGVLLAVPVYPQYQVQVLGLTNTQISYLSMGWTVAWLAGYALFGQISDRTGPRLIVLMAAALYMGMPLAYGIGTSFVLLFVGALTQGAADAAMDLGTWAFILQTNPDRVGAYTSAHMMMVGVRGALAPLLGTGVLALYGMQAAFLLAAAMVAAGLTVLISARPAAT